MSAGSVMMSHCFHCGLFGAGGRGDRKRQILIFHSRKSVDNTSDGKKSRIGGKNMVFRKNGGKYKKKLEKK